ncbi:MAG: hypothetical protein K9G76_01585 [Bacteroidales bacterium]|nr:hypothetical protein [Bacteroidales bacterium]MCF8403245.1 hypothetical protein [Bacteroidales bacterium]
MKRTKEKIGIRTKEMSEATVPQTNVQKIVFVLLILSLTACEKAWYGSDGRPGDAYLALTWYEAEPEYLDAGTSAIPPVFYWDEYYRIQPGYYNLYYEGSVWAGLGWAYYGWDVDYEIYEIAGERGDWYYNGGDGPDNFFIIECNPYGPYVGSSYKSKALDEKYTLLEEDDSTIKVQVKADGIGMTITYKKIEVERNPKALTKIE